MAKYKITKKKVIEAIINEPLRASAFFHLFGGDKVDDGKCSVCAVGAVLRNTKKNRFNSTEAKTLVGDCYTAYHVDDAWDSDNFLSILSSEFEHADDEVFVLRDEGFIETEDMDHFARFHALMVVNAICPDVLEFETEN